MTEIISIATLAEVILSVLFSWKIKIGNKKADAYWIFSVFGAALLLLTQALSISGFTAELFANNDINPIKILVLFLSMSMMSVFLDEMGLFKYLAAKAASSVKGSQTKLFAVFYATVSVLTVFTSNDIVILTFTPFICEFCKNSKISPVPYIISEFVAANTWSMLLIIGNPTNIFIATSYGMDFAEYAGYMVLPAVCGGAVSFLLCRLIFAKYLKTPFSESDEKCTIENKFLVGAAVFFLGGCIAMMALSSVTDIPMWIISLTAFLCLMLVCTVYSSFHKRYFSSVKNTFRHAPWQVIPFVISMFAVITALGECGGTARLYSLLGEKAPVFVYGISSYFTCNLCNNIPMSLLFSNILKNYTGTGLTGAVLASVIGSNLGALLTPVGALAGIMWSGLVKEHGVKFSFLDFIKYGAAVSIPTLLLSLCALSVSVNLL